MEWSRRVFKVAGDWLDTKRVNIIMADPSDNIFLECALEAKADFLVSGDSHLLRLGEFEGARIARAKTVLEFLSG